MSLLHFDPEEAIRKAQAKVDQKRARGPLTGAFVAKGVVLAALVAAGVVGLAQRYTLAIATQEYLCLPPYRIWVIDKWDKTPARGEIFAFKAQGLSPVFVDGTTIVKVLEGMPGDVAEVTVAQTKINGVTVGTGLQVAVEKGIDPERYVRSGTIESGRYWFFGQTADSFDSRYWGSVDGSQFIGRAYPIW